MQEQRFDRVIGMVTERHGHRPFPENFVESLITQLARGHLSGNARAVSAISGSHLHGAEGDPTHRAMGFHKKPIAIARRAAQAMVHMQHRAGMAEFHQHVQQRHTIHPTAHGHPHRLTGLQELFTADVSPYLIQHGAGR
jgi:hypothetical protein